MPNRKLVEYAHRFLNSRPSGTMTPEELAADFAAQLRAGCHQDLKRLIEQCISNTPARTTGKQALRNLSDSLTLADLGSWGLPDCDCNKPDCVYCSSGMAIMPAVPVAG